MNWRHYQRVRGAFAAFFIAASALGAEPAVSPDPALVVQEIGRQLEALPEPPEALLDNLQALQSTISNLVSNLEDAQRAEAKAHARMASWTGAILARELKKVSASARLIELTEKTGRTEEVTRYRERHQRLLDTISDTATHYESMIRHLGTLDPELRAYGFDQYQQHLVGNELASQIGIHRVVRKQVEQLVETGNVDLEAWQEELQSL